MVLSGVVEEGDQQQFEIFSRLSKRRDLGFERYVICSLYGIELTLNSALSEYRQRDTLLAGIRQGRPTSSYHSTAIFVTLGYFFALTLLDFIGLEG